MAMALRTVEWQALCSPPGGGGTRYIPEWGGAAPHTLTLFKTNIADFPTLFKKEFRFLEYSPPPRVCSLRGRRSKWNKKDILTITRLKSPFPSLSNAATKVIHYSSEQDQSTNFTLKTYDEYCP